MELSLQGVEREAEGSEREGTKEIAVTGLAKNHVSSADAVLVAKKGAPFSPRDFPAISEPEVLGRKRLDSQFVENRCRNNAIDRTRIDQKLDLTHLLRPGDIGYFDTQYRQSHASILPQRRARVGRRRRLAGVRARRWLIGPVAVRLAILIVVLIDPVATRLT